MIIAAILATTSIYSVTKAEEDCYILGSFSGGSNSMESDQLQGFKSSKEFGISLGAGYNINQWLSVELVGSKPFMSQAKDLEVKITDPTFAEYVKLYREIRQLFRDVKNSYPGDMPSASELGGEFKKRRNDLQKRVNAFGLNAYSPEKVKNAKLHHEYTYSILYTTQVRGLATIYNQDSISSYLGIGVGVAGVELKKSQDALEVLEVPGHYKAQESKNKQKSKFSHALLVSATIGVAYEIAKGLKLGFEYSPSYIKGRIKLPEKTGKLDIRCLEGKIISQLPVESVSIKSLKHDFALRLTWAL